MKILWVLFALFSFRADCARILCVFQMPAVSHQASLQPISRELSLRGHEVIAVTPRPIKDPSLVNLTEIDTSYIYEIIHKHGFEFFMSKELTVQSKIAKIFAMYEEFAEAIFSNEHFRRIYTDPNQKFDLIIAQIYISPTMFALSHKLNSPIIGVSSMGGWTGTHVAIGNHNPPSIYSEMFLHYNGELTFYERIKSTLYYVWSRWYIYWVAMPRCDAIARKYLGPDLPYLADIERNVSALFLNINPILYTVRPMVPTVVPLGFMHVRPAKPLPQDIQDEIESAKNGVVYFSLGSNVKSVNIPQRVRDLLMNTFAELPYKIIWKFEGEELPGKPENVVIRKWLPQQDILAHPNVKVFVTQCGLQSTEEAIDREKPMVAIPFIADQEMDAKRLVEQGVAVWIDYETTNKEEIKNSIIEVAENPIYRQNIKRLRFLLQDQPMTGLERAVWWSEYVIRHRGTKHLRSPTVDIEWHKYLLLDIIAAMLGFVVILVFVIAKLIRMITRSCSLQRNVKFKNR
ncbi:UDP-glycosyltransferase UGT5-like [Cylas formicarius]|uniref:UDP-glycosyltransferase UGT5-like n=1 Tax=Cylas formicarius TaxID=197179 RepID=UPI0029585DEB|nr:UDP-glycosyltransferase UGT5-like [Cylas formicarius]